jgi:hypothetical protein
VINVKLESDAKVLGEVVVTGYGTVAKKKSSISQVKVSAATIEKTKCKFNTNFVRASCWS